MSTAGLGEDQSELTIQLVAGLSQFVHQLLGIHLNNDGLDVVAGNMTLSQLSGSKDGAESLTVAVAKAQSELTGFGLFDGGARGSNHIEMTLDGPNLMQGLDGHGLIHIGTDVLLLELAQQVAGHMDGAAGIFLANLVYHKAKDTIDHHVVQDLVDSGKGNLHGQGLALHDATEVTSHLLSHHLTAGEPDHRDLVLSAESGDEGTDILLALQIFQGGAGVENQVAIPFALVHGLGDGFNLLHSLRLRAGQGLAGLGGLSLAALGHGNGGSFLLLGSGLLCALFLFLLAKYIHNCHF